MVGRKRKRLGDLLIGAGVISIEQLGEALKKQKELGLRLGETLIELNYTDENEIVEAIHKQMGFPIARVREAKLQPEVIALLSESIVRKHRVLPFEVDENNPNILRVAMENPLNIIAIDDLSIVTNMQIDPMVASPSDIRFGIERYYGNEQVAKMADAYSKERKEQISARESQEADNEEVDTAPIVVLVNKIIEQAVKERASDIHIEALEDSVRVRFRIDGVMQEMMRYEKELLPAIVARIKIISGMNISEKRAPQDGRMTQRFDRVEYDIRVSSLPTVFGEKIVMRLASKSALTRDKKDLGFPEEELRRFEALVKNPHGIILVTGPTGSGKSTTLASLIGVISKNYKKTIITLEDPIEYLHGHGKGMVLQREIGYDSMSYANAVRAALRQDPDVILVGEMRDLETISIAITAAETGHLVFSTLHTNSAASAVDRMIDVFPPFQQQQIRVQLAGVLEGVVAQQLLPRQEGGRVAAYEVMLAVPAIRNLIREEKSFQIPSIIQTNKKMGMQTMDDAIYDLYMKSYITAETAISFAHDAAGMSQKINLF